MARFLFGLFLIVAGSSALLEGEGSLFSLLLLGLGGKLLADHRSRREDRKAAGSAVSRNRPSQRASRGGGRRQTQGHADLAVRNAGHNPATMDLRVDDLGVFAICHERETLVHRVQPVRDDVDYIQPWVSLRLPTVAVGTIGFEIRDMDDRLHFRHDRRLQLEAGENLVSPAARMPVHDALLTEGDWQLCVYADGRLLAAHSFFWVEAEAEGEESRPRVHLQEDGEMNDDLRQAFEASSRQEEVSLDELLEFQQRRT
ncbi:MAG: hypothetical protein OXB89_10665 [Anaerolineaceae bacterium]|nr:hypothetical protein [Anaerolineaceae bacterium]